MCPFRQCSRNQEPVVKSQCERDTFTLNIGSYTEYRLKYVINVPSVDVDGTAGDDEESVYRAYIGRVYRVYIGCLEVR